MEKGYLSIILHAHLPYVRHPEHESFFEENWLFEAMTESYIPLLGMLDRLQRDNIDYRLTVSLSPTLMTLLRDELLAARYLQQLRKQLELADKEIVRTRNQPEYQRLARWYRRYFLKTLEAYQNQYQCDLLAAFRQHQAAGKLELITCAATHGFLPLLGIGETAVRNQIDIGIETFEQHMGHLPKGFWLPECGFYPGLEKLLKEAGIRYFFVDTHGITQATRQTRYGVYAPIDCGNGVAAFGRDPYSSHQVWSAEQGYPGDPDYREYYRDIGFDLDLNYIAPYILDGTTRIHTGIKYYRVTGKERDKQLYQPRHALAKARLHARDFITQRQRQMERLALEMDRPPIVVAPYDAELFGHWWFEGPLWLEQVLRLANEPGSSMRTVSCSDYLAHYPVQPIAIPSASTWGDQGYSGHWINEQNDWIWPHLHKAAEKMEQLAVAFRGVKPTALQRRALNQAARSLLLAQASDWPFIMKSGTTVEYANKRITDHLARFNYLYDCIRNNRIDERYLTALEIMDDIFPNIDYRRYKPPQYHG